MTIDQTHGGWIPPHEPVGLLPLLHPRLGRGERAAASRLVGRGRCFVSPGRAPISAGRRRRALTGRSAWTTESGTTVWRAQQAKL